MGVTDKGQPSHHHANVRRHAIRLNRGGGTSYSDLLRRWLKFVDLLIHFLSFVLSAFVESLTDARDCYAERRSHNSGSPVAAYRPAGGEAGPKGRQRAELRRA